MRADAGPEADLQEGSAKCVLLNQRKYALFKVDGTVYCVDNTCTHAGGPLCEGTLDRFVVRCPWHGSRFDVRTGQVVGPPARTPMKSYPVAIEGGRIWVQLALDLLVAQGQEMTAAPSVNPMEPFANETLLNETLDELGKFEYKLYGGIPVKLHRGEPTKYEFDLNLGVIHFTEQDVRGLSAIFSMLNEKWGTVMTYCIYPSKTRNRDMILNVRGSPMAPAEID